MRIYRLDDETGAEHFVIAKTPEGATKAVTENTTVEQRGAEELDTPVELPFEKELTLHADRKAIKHTVEDWIVIYECGGDQYLACSEY